MCAQILPLNTVMLKETGVVTILHKSGKIPEIKDLLTISLIGSASIVLALFKILYK